MQLWPSVAHAEALVGPFIEWQWGTDSVSADFDARQ